MVKQQMDYGRLVEEALRRVVHDALELVVAHGLPGRHHLYITFRTDHPGVVIDAALSDRYPAEMTIVLQHEFWDLEVRDDGFAVGLSFGDEPHRLEIPFDAISVFADPSVEFGLQFTVPDDEGAAATAEETSAAPTALPQGPGRAGPRPTVADGDEAATNPDDEGGGAEVVTLDRFRKK